MPIEYFNPDANTADVVSALQRDGAAIVKKSDFYKVGKMLKSNRSLKKKAGPKRYPYILTGLVYCLDCGDRLCGKSAHGRSGKVGYYEHGWRYRKDFCKTDKMHNCTSPNRFAAKKVHEAVIGKIAEILSSKKMAKNLLARARSIDKKDPIKAEIKRYKGKVINLDRKLEMLTERLTELPKDVSANLIYSKMATLEKQKKEITTLLEVKRKELKGVSDSPVDFESFCEFLEVFTTIFKEQLSPDEQGKDFAADFGIQSEEYVGGKIAPRTDGKSGSEPAGRVETND